METQSVEVTDRDTLPPAATFSDASDFNVAYERRLAEIKAVPDEALITLNIDVHAAIATVLGALPEIRALRDELGKLPNLNMAFVDGLEEYAEAAAEANSRFVTAMTPEEDILALNEAASRARETFRLDAVALANRGLIDPGKLAAFKGLTGYKNVGFELIDWANLMRDSWQSIQGKTAFSIEEVQNAKRLGERLVRAAGLREQGPAVLADVARIRQQAVSLLVMAYDEVRRGVSFLRWREDDVDTIAPSLYAGRGHKRAELPAPAQPAPAEQPAAPPVTAGPAQPAAPVAAPALGLPGAKPFALV